MKYPEDFINKIICGDCLEVMKTMPDDCIDTIITDPPYKIEFMASLPPIQSAINIDGQGDGARIKLDIPASEMEQVIEFAKINTKMF